MTLRESIQATTLALVLVVLAPAQDASRSPSRTEARSESVTLARGGFSEGEQPSIESFLNERVGYWRQRLKLEDWHLAVVISRRDMLRPGTLGKIQWDKKRKSAAIQVMHPSDYKVAFEPMLADMEFTVVHELVHLSLAALPRNEASRQTEEDVVNRLAEALFSVDSRLREPSSPLPTTADLRPDGMK